MHPACHISQKRPSITITNPGSSYGAAPTVTFDNTGTGGSGAAATTTITGGGVSTSRSISDVVTEITITNGGSSYTSAPTVTISGGGGGSGATATATIVNGVVTGVTITATGSGYTSAPTITFNNTGTGGSGAAGTATLATSAALAGSPASTSNRFTGAIDEAAFFNGALTQAQIQAEYNARSGGTYSTAILGQGPVAYYRLDEAAPATLVGAGVSDQFGTAVAGLGTGKVIVSAFLDDGASPVTSNLGVVYVFDTATGNLLQTLPNQFPMHTGAAQFGQAVVGVGNYIVIGTPFEDYDGGDMGLVQIFDGTTGALLRTLQNPNPPSPTAGTADHFGAALAAVGTDKVLVGAPFNDRGALDAGAAYLFDVATGELLASFSKASASLTGTITGATNANPIVITSANHGLVTGTQVVISGVLGNTNANGVRTITVIDQNSFSLNGVSGNANYTGGGTWTASAQFGAAVAASGNHVAIGAPFADFSGASDAGAAYVFQTQTGLSLSATTLPEGGSTTLTGSFTDPGFVDTHTVTINWGDGTPATVVSVPALPQAATVALSTPYAYGGHIYYAIRDGGLTWQQAEAQAQLVGGHLTTINSLGENQFVVETIRREYGSDLASWIGISDTAADGTFAWANGDPILLTRWATGQPANTVGTDAAAINQGGGGNWTTFPSTQTFTGAIIEIDGTSRFSPAHTYTNNGSYTISVSVIDKDGAASNTDSTVATVTNVAPTVTAPALQSATENGPATFGLGSFADPGNDSPWSVDVNWGDSSSHTTFSTTSTGALGSQAHNYAEEGSYTVTVKVTDKDGAFGSATFQITVADATLTAGAFTPPAASSAPILTTFTPPGLLTSGFYGLAFDVAGNLYVSDYNTASGTVSKVTPSGFVSTFASSGFIHPVGMTFDAAGNLYVANYYNTVSKVTATGVVTTFVSTGLNGAEDVAFDAAGNLYVANYNDSTITKVTPAGVVSTFVSSGLNGPDYLAFDS